MMADLLGTWLSQVEARVRGNNGGGSAPSGLPTAFTNKDFTQTIQGAALKVAQVGIASIGYTYLEGSASQTSFADNLIYNSPSRPCYNIQIVNDDATNWLEWSYDGISIAGKLKVGEFTTDPLIPPFTQLYLISVLQTGGSTTTAFRLKVW